MVGLVAERVISVSKENVNLKLVISLTDRSVPDASRLF
jgi:hypothetical protein